MGKFGINTEVLAGTGLTLKEFWCDNDLSKYTDSMLFDMHQTIASARFGFEGTQESEFVIVLEVAGYVNVIYKDETCRYASEFPEELIEYIKSNPDWMHKELLDEQGEPMLFVSENNWFEYLYGVDVLVNGIIYESEIDKASEQEIFDEMVSIAQYALGL